MHILALFWPLADAKFKIVVKAKQPARMPAGTYKSLKGLISPPDPTSNFSPQRQTSHRTSNIHPTSNFSPTVKLLTQR